MFLNLRKIPVSFTCGGCTERIKDLVFQGFWPTGRWENFRKSSPGRGGADHFPAHKTNAAWLWREIPVTGKGITGIFRASRKSIPVLAPNALAS